MYYKTVNIFKGGIGMNIDKAIKVLKKVRHWIDYGAGELEPTANAVIEAIDTVVAELENPTYTVEDMEAFFLWASDNGWFYGKLTEMWHNYAEIDINDDYDTSKRYSIDDLVKIWEQQRKEATE